MQKMHSGTLSLPPALHPQNCSKRISTTPPLHRIISLSPSTAKLKMAERVRATRWSNLGFRIPPGIVLGKMGEVGRQTATGWMVGI
jgi:hypothetical protein